MSLAPVKVLLGSTAQSEPGPVTLQHGDHQSRGTAGCHLDLARMEKLAGLKERRAEGAGGCGHISHDSSTGSSQR